MSDLEKYKDKLFVKIRSTGKLTKAKVELTKENVAVDIFEGEYGVSPGQACVFYSKNIIGEKVLGGGWISRTKSDFYPHT